MKKYIVITGGAGFVGSNLINLFLERTKFYIISYDNYSTGLKKNHVKNIRVKYIKGHTKNLSKNLKAYKNNINSIFHFGEFSRIYQSFLNLDDCISSNVIGTNEVIRFCLKNKIKLIYSATSATLGNSGEDKNLSPYAFTKYKNLEMLENLKKWYNLKFEIIYFYNVYGSYQISQGKMATVIGIFENAIKNKLFLPVVKPGTQLRRFTHIKDTVEICFFAWKQNKLRHYSISSRKSHSIIDIANLFRGKIKYIPERKGERYVSALVNTNLSNKVYKKYGKIKIADYIKEFLSKNIK
tara:strand:+ start:19287 stop:20174 length:888 start_codon:yes stop_codon:yes gene_type:complete